MGKLKIKYGTFASYNSLATKDPDTLYFITDSDRGGTVYKGTKLVTQAIKVELGGQDDQQVMTITDYSKSTPSVYTVRSSAAITAIVSSIEGAISAHRAIGDNSTADGKATGSSYGHAKLSDATDGTETAADGGTAATPKAVKDALNAAKEYADGIVGGLSGAMVFKGTIGAAADNPTVTDLPDTHGVGDTYRVVTAGTYAGQSCEIGDMIICVTAGTTAFNSDWTVAQNNIDGAVTTTDTLTANTLVLGNGNGTVKKLPAGTDGYYLTQGSNGPEWTQFYNAKFGSGYGTCSTAAATTAKVGTLDAFVLKKGGVAALKFTYANTKASATLNINSTGAKPIFWRGAAITADYIIEAGDTVSFMYDGTRYHIISIDRPIDTALSPTSRNAVRNSVVHAALAGKQDTLTPGDGVLIGTVNNTDNTIHLDYGAVEAANTAKPVTGAAVHSAIGAAALVWEEITPAE